MNLSGVESKYDSEKPSPKLEPTFVRLKSGEEIKAHTLDLGGRRASQLPGGCYSDCRKDAGAESNSIPI